MNQSCCTLSYVFVAGVGFEPHDLKVMGLASYHCSTPQYKWHGMTNSNLPFSNAAAFLERA